MLPSWMTVVTTLRTLLTWFVGGMEQSLVCFCHGLRFCCAYCCCLKKKMLFVCLMIDFLAVWAFFVLIFTYW